MTMLSLILIYLDLIPIFWLYIKVRVFDFPLLSLPPLCLTRSHPKLGKVYTVLLNVPLMAGLYYI